PLPAARPAVRIDKPEVAPVLRTVVAAGLNELSKLCVRDLMAINEESGQFHGPKRERERQPGTDHWPALHAHHFRRHHIVSVECEPDPPRRTKAKNLPVARLGGAPEVITARQAYRYGTLRRTCDRPPRGLRLVVGSRRHFGPRRGAAY